MKRSRAQSYAVNLRYPDAARCGVTSPSASKNRILEMVTSGKSGLSSSRTAPIDIPARAGLSGALKLASGSSVVVALLGPGQEHQAELADLDLVAVGQRRRIHRFAIDVGAVEAPHVHDVEFAAFQAEFGMTTAHRHVVEE